MIDCLVLAYAKHMRTLGSELSPPLTERSPSPRVTGQSIDIHGPAIETIKRMKLEEAVRSRHTTEEGTTFLNSSGKIFAQFNAEYEILRADSSQIFLEAPRA